MATSPLQELLDQFANRLAFVEKQMGIEGAVSSGLSSGGGGAAAAAAADDDLHPSVEKFDSYCLATLEPFKAACAAIGTEEATFLSGIVAETWAFQRQLLICASKCKKPKDTEISAMCTALTEIQAKLKPFDDKQFRKRGPYELHCKAIKAVLQVSMWVFYEPTKPEPFKKLPGDYIEDCAGEADFSLNKVRMLFPRNDPKFDQNQHDFCTHLKAMCTKLQTEYVKENFKTGLMWKGNGGDPVAFMGSAPAAAPAPAAAAPPAAAAAEPEAGGAGGGIADIGNALAGFSTGGLKKVTKDMQTWRSEFKGGDAPAPSKAKKATPAARPVVSKVKGTKKVAFNQRRQAWEVEAQEKGDGVVEVPITDVKHSVVIYGCFDATINITGKCKGITMDSCEKVQVLCDTSISAVELVNCKRMKIQIRETAPTVNIDKTDGCLVYLSEAGLGTTFTTAKSSEMNVAFPQPGTDDLMEVPIPEQFVHNVILDGAKPHMSAEISDLYS